VDGRIDQDLGFEPGWSGWKDGPRFGFEPGLMGCEDGPRFGLNQDGKDGKMVQD